MPVCHRNEDKRPAWGSRVSLGEERQGVVGLQVKGHNNLWKLVCD